MESFKKLFESELEWGISRSGKLSYGVSVMSIKKDSAVIASNKVDKGKIYKEGSEIVFRTNKYEKTFSSLQKLVDFLNKGNYVYVGIDSI